MTNTGIHGILSQNHTYAIVSPTGQQNHNLEIQHNTVHLWIGGNMDDLSTSAEDPVFFLHHSFIDYLWEEFRTRQKLMGINPETDYPTGSWGGDRHAPEASLGFGDLRNVDALSNVLANMVKYDPSPVCTRSYPTCLSKYLRCDSTRAHPICVSLSRDEIHGNRRHAHEVCVEAHLTRAVQNTFAINQFCDMRRWSYIPVKIVLQRPPEFSNYKAYPVYNNRPVTTTDVFSTISINKTISKSLAAYPTCRHTSSVARKIYVESYGLNYYGKYKDFTVLDQRHALSSATTYLGVKRPDTNYTDVIVYAFDYCGRTCRPFCLNMSVSPPKSSPCNGVIRITPDKPKLYGDNYAEAVNGVWSADHPDALPEVAPEPAFITFYCDYSGVWPWDPEIQMKSRANMRSENNVHNLQLKPVFREPNSINNVNLQTSIQNSVMTSEAVHSSSFTNMHKSVTKIRSNVFNKSPRIRSEVFNNAPRIRSSVHILNNAPRIISIIKTKKRKPLPTTPRSKVEHIPSFVVIDLSSATSRPPIQRNKQKTNTIYLGKAGEIRPESVSQKRLFANRHTDNEFQIPQRSSHMTTEGFLLRGNI